MNQRCTQWVHLLKLLWHGGVKMSAQQEAVRITFDIYKGVEQPLQRIDVFKDEYVFLRNSYHSEFTFEGIRYLNAVSAFQAQKCKHIMDKFQFANLTPIRAKRKGKEVNTRADWDVVKDDIMYNVVKEKFSQNEELKSLLLNTGTSYLEDGNSIKEVYWGTYKGKGLNKLGHILMRVRSELK